MAAAYTGGGFLVQVGDTPGPVFQLHVALFWYELVVGDDDPALGLVAYDLVEEGVAVALVSFLGLLEGPVEFGEVVEAGYPCQVAEAGSHLF
ncbi:MAG: hypothetical protein IH969_00135 [Candidatus Krumholzibacteriota bacterium]|nr:hypothetical protein [Candidatus Krumholzibacteriota bacterium]